MPHQMMLTLALVMSRIEHIKFLDFAEYYAAMTS